MSTSQAGRTPRRTTRRATATPVRDTSPPARNTRAASTALNESPATRRSTRATSRRPEQPTESVNNNALPEIQTRQSYAYGSSKIPLLPEQLYARDPLTMKQVAEKMDTAMTEGDDEVEDDDDDDLEEDQPQPQQRIKATQNARQTSRQPSSPVSVTTDLQKKRRTAAWASSLDNGQLEDIPEEQQQQRQKPLETPDTRRSDVSSFPSGIFDHSYQYERGLRPPRRPPKPKTVSIGAKIGTLFDRFISGLDQLRQQVIDLLRATGQWLVRALGTLSMGMTSLPGKWIIITLAKILGCVALLGLLNYAICFGYTRYLCNPAVDSRLSQTIESWCGACQATSNQTELPLTSGADVRQLTLALKRIDSQIKSVESRLNSRMDNQLSNIHTDIDGLRQEQASLVGQIAEISSHSPAQPDTPYMPPSFVPSVNYFSPANGAIINPHLTSPTRQVPLILPFRLATRLLRIKRYKGPGPMAALEPWNDVGDCWCAAATVPGQDSIRLAVGIIEYIFPTELVIEHPSRETTLMPETAPRLIELWANFDHLTPIEWSELGIDQLTNKLPDTQNPFGGKYALLASIDFELGTHGESVQTFALDVNQHGDLKHAANEYAVRVRSTHGSDFGCLYRVRLHGVPVVKKDAGSADGVAPEHTTTHDEVLN